MNYKLFIICSIVIICIIILIVFLTTKKKEKFENNCPYSSPDIPCKIDMAKYNSLSKQLNAYVPKKDGKYTDNSNYNTKGLVNDVLEADETYTKICCQLALITAKNCNFGIGDVIVDPLMVLKPFLKDATVVVPDKNSQTGKVVNYLDFLSKVLQSLGYTKDQIDNDQYLSKIVGLGMNQIFYQGWFDGQFVPHLRSDLHGEMVAMNLLEDAIASIPFQTQCFQTRSPPGLKLYTQLESCSQCTSRLASSSISEVVYAGPDNGGGMSHALCNLPPVFQQLVDKQIIGPAKISDELIELCFQSFYISIAEAGIKQNNRFAGCETGTCPSYDYCKPWLSQAVSQRAQYDLQGFAPMDAGR